MTKITALLLGLAPLSAYAAESDSPISLSCQQAINAQWNAYLAIFNAVTETCKTQNAELKKQGFPHCATLCTDKAIKVLASPSTEISIKVGNESSKSSYGNMTGMPSTGGTPAATLQSVTKRTLEASSLTENVDVPEKIYISATVTLKIPMGPTTTVECTNPINNPTVRDFASAILNSTWAQERYRKACGS
jgi:hypothetical protein